MIHFIGYIIGLLFVAAFLFLTWVTWKLLGRFFPAMSYPLRGMFSGIAYSLWIGLFLLLLYILYIPGAHSGADEGEFFVGAAIILFFAGLPSSLLAIFLTQIFLKFQFLIICVLCLINSTLLGLLFGLLLKSSAGNKTRTKH